MSEKKHDTGDAIWNFLCSLKLTIITLLLLAITSVIGTVIQQNKPAQEYIQEYGETTYRVFKMLNFDDMYNAWWFVGLLVLFCLNLICCSIKRMPALWRTVKNPNLTPAEGFFKSIRSSESFESGLSVEETTDRLRAVLNEKFAKPIESDKEGVKFLFAQKAPWARFGVYVTHSSILIIFLGSIIGNIWGFKAFVNIVEGTSVDQVWIRGQEAPHKLGFSVRCDDFDVTYYDGTNRPKEFMSILDVIDNGQEVVTDRKIIVNDPITYKGITFYQSSYGAAGDPTYKMKITPKGGKAFEVTVKDGVHTPLPNGGSFAISGYAATYQQFGPAIQMHINDPAGKHGNPFILYQNYPDFDKNRSGDYQFSFLDYNELQYTGLQVKKDPGVEIVWFGSFLMIFGSMAAFMIAHRKVWIRIEKNEKGTSTIKIAGNSHRNQAAFEPVFEKLATDFKDALK